MKPFRGGDCTVESLVWVAAENELSQLWETWQLRKPAGNTITASKHTQTIPDKTACLHPFAQSIVWLSCIYPVCCRLCVTARWSCVCALCRERQRGWRGVWGQEGEGKVRQEGISRNCLLSSLSVSREISAPHCLIFSPAVILSPMSTLDKFKITYFSSCWAFIHTNRS